MHLHDLMGWSGPMTWKQYTTWLAWLELDMERPSRNDWYIHRLTEMTAHKNLPTIKFSIPKVSQEETVAMAKQRAIARTGGKVIRKVVKRGDNSTGS